jgi:hypothetical protein
MAVEAKDFLLSNNFPYQVWGPRSLLLNRRWVYFPKIKNVTCYSQMIVAIVDVLTSFIFMFTNDNR